MIFEDLEIIWRDEQSHPTHTLDNEALRQIVVDRARNYRQKVFWRDVSDIGVHIFTVLLIIGVGIWAVKRSGEAVYGNLVPMLVIAAGYTFASGFRFVGRLRQQQRERQFDDSIRGNLEKLVANADYQIRLQQNYAWWYILPVFLGFALLAASHWSSGPEAFWFMTSFVGLIFWFIWWCNKHSVRTDLIPQKKELKSLLAGLENGGQTAEIRAVCTEIPTVSRGRKLFGFALAAWIFGIVAWFLIANFWPAASLRAPDFDDISALSESDQAKIDGWLQEIVEDSQYPSLSVAIVRGDKVAYRGVFGFENTWTKRKATPTTAYNVASVTKVFTASLAVVLHERGVIDLDEPVAKYLPRDVSLSDTPERGAQITFRQLASHTSGLPRSVPGNVQSVNWPYRLEPERLYALLSDVTLEHDPGTGEHYSNLGFGLLGHALELAAKKPFNDLLQEHLCRPMGLEHTSIHIDKDMPIATGYSTPPRLPERVSYKRRLAGSGGLVTSAGDLAKFLLANLGSGPFSTNSLALLHTSTKPKNGSESTRALGWRRDTDIPAARVLSKSGGRKNCSAWIGFAPDRKVGVVVLANIGAPDVDPIGEWLLARAIPGGNRPASEHGAAKVAPFDGIRWENGLPVVRVQGSWSELVSINDIPIERIIEFARAEHGEQARMRFGEDLPQVLFEMGHMPDWQVTLGLKRADGKVQSIKVRMTEENRERVRDRRLESETRR